MAKLPMAVTAALLRHMSEEGVQSPQADRGFSGLEEDEVKETFAWLAERLEVDLQDEAKTTLGMARELVELTRGMDISEQTRKVLSQLSPEEGYRLLKSFGAID